MLLSVSADASVAFDHVFSPQEGLTVPIEQPWRQEICLNGSWEFQPVDLPAGYDLKNGAPVLPAPSPNGWSVTPIRVPSPWNVNAFRWGGGPTFPSYPAAWEKARMGWLRRQFTVPSGWQGKRLILHFEAVSGSVQVLVNGHELAQHFDNSIPFEVDVTDFVNFDAENSLMLGIRQASLFDAPGQYGKITYPSGSPWNMQMIGVWQDIFLRALPPLRVEDIAIRPLVDQGVLELAVTVRNNTASAQSFRLGGQVLPWISQAGTDVVAAAEPHWSLGPSVLVVGSLEGNVGPKTVTNLILRQPIHGELSLWTPDTPNLYGLVLNLQQDDKTEDRFYQRFGWRQWSIKGRDVTLNGKPIQLLGDSGHLLGVQFLSRRFAWSWYHALKTVHGNAIRLHATVRPRFYLDLADEMGIAILDESDIWASTMDINYTVPETWMRFAAHIDGMVLRDRNHPSVFGWSIANEIYSALWFKAVPREFWPPIVDKMVDLAGRVQALDPTRAWISSDGDGDFHGRLPAYTYHYGEPRDWLRNAPKDRPYGFGEAGSMVWGSPVVFSAYNGDRSYENTEGMMEGVAIEIYHYLVEQLKFAAFCSTFTFEGQAFRSLPIGMADRTKTPTPNDGIVFGPLVEGRPGIQPERLSPYTTCFNPGYDPNLPLFEPTPVYEAYTAAWTPGGPVPCQWDHFAKSTPLPAPPPATIQQVAFVGDSKGRLKMALESSGVLTLADQAKKRSKLLVIDGATLAEAQVPEARSQMSEVLRSGGTVFVWASPENLTPLNALLPAPVALEKQEATALLADRKAPETSSISLASLYFQDQSDKLILKSSLAGPLVEKSRVLMESNSVSRRSWGTTQTSKAAALIACESGSGRLLVTSLMPDVRSARRLQLLRSLFANLGVALAAPSKTHDTGIDGAGFVNRALVVGSFQGERYPKILEKDFLGGEAHVDPKPGDKTPIEDFNRPLIGLQIMETGGQEHEHLRIRLGLLAQHCLQRFCRL